MNIQVDLLSKEKIIITENPNKEYQKLELNNLSVNINEIEMGFDTDDEAIDLIHKILNENNISIGEL
jgi:hypothetical protein